MRTRQDTIVETVAQQDDEITGIRVEALTQFQELAEDSKKSLVHLSLRILSTVFDCLEGLPVQLPLSYPSPSLVTCHLPLATCHLSLATCHLPLLVTCHLSPVTCHLPLVSSATCHLPLATCHLPLVTCHLPLATCHLSAPPLVTCHLPLVTTCQLRHYLSLVTCQQASLNPQVGRKQYVF